MAAPKGAKVPQDHKQKEETAKVEKVTRTFEGRDDVTGVEVTYRGHTVFVPDEVRDDWELVEDTGAMQAGRNSDVGGVFRRYVGHEQYEALKEEFRDAETGRVPREEFIEFFGQVVKAANPS